MAERIRQPDHVPEEVVVRRRDRLVDRRQEHRDAVVAEPGELRIAGGQGAEAVRRSIEACFELGVSYLTLFGFSSENWKRPEAEVMDLMVLLRRYLQSEIAELHKNGVRVRVIGERSRFSPDPRTTSATSCTTRRSP